MDDRSRSVTRSASAETPAAETGGTPDAAEIVRQTDSLFSQVDALFDQFHTSVEELKESVAKMAAMRESRLQMDKEKYYDYADRQSNAVRELHEIPRRAKDLVRPVRDLLTTAAFMLAPEGRDLLQSRQEFDLGFEDLPSAQDHRDDRTSAMLTLLRAAIVQIREVANRHLTAKPRCAEPAPNAEAEPAAIAEPEPLEEALPQEEPGREGQEALSIRRKALLDKLKNEEPGRTVVGFCKAAGIDHGDFYKWRRGELLDTSATTKKIEDALKSPDVRSRWLE